MGKYLNSIAPYEAYKDIAGTRFFADKTDLIREVISAATTDGQRYLCITRPRRFGKTVMANMLGAFFGKAADAESLFGCLKIAGCACYRAYLNQWDVISIDFSRLPRDCKSYESYIERIQNGINQDLAEAYPQYMLSIEGAVWDNLQLIFEKTRTRFIFIIDEWDAIFHKDFIDEENKKSYLEFLRDMLKGQAYVQLAYMTGILPIAKYSSGSEINMFQEYDMAAKEKYSLYFGFTDLEVDRLFSVYQKTVKNAKVTRKDLAEWYDGYHTAAGARLYNPRSVICALTDNQISSYWTNSGPYDEIFYYIHNNIQEVRDDLVLMVAGERIEIKLQGYAATSAELNTKNQIYSAMVVYGLLTYENGAVFIPNRELMEQFQELLLSKDSLGYVHSLAKESEKMLKATLAGNTDLMADILKYAHNTESPIFSYNSEIELSAVVNLVYLSARDKYRVEREDKAGKGYVDFIFYPEQKTEDAFILELKTDSTPKEAVRQIKEKNYALRFQGKLGEKAKYTGRILAVGISYDRKTKEHSCMVEVL
ncbi:MAG: ATP-binding protein [Eubacterium sp.]|nr:ATP-binding protein [Eubacterium sp.]